MPHQIIEISELTQLVADDLLLDGQQSLVSLACTCRALEEQVLSTLWSEQSSLEILIESTLPRGVVTSSRLLLPVQPTRTEWDKFRRYASWMRRLDFGTDPRVGKEILHLISVNSPNGIMCPGLRELRWIAQSYTLPSHRLFHSPHLTSFSFLGPFLAGKVPEWVLSNLISVITELPTSSLQYLQIDLDIAEEVIPTTLKLAISSTVLRCGPSLTTLSVSAPLSDAALKHIMRLPKLSTWRAMNGPPKGPDLSLSHAFPQLKTLVLPDKASLEWLPLFEASTRRPSSGQDVHVLSHRGPVRTLTTLNVWVRISVDAALMSHIIPFHGLVELALESSCSNAGGCAFRLTDDDVAAVATALPNLVDATFGHVCSANSCQTTASSLAFLSTRCKNLKNLEIHFNLTNLLDDFKSIPEDPRLHDLCARPRCRLERLTVSYASLLIGEEGYGAVVTGFLGIFQSLDSVVGRGAGWYRLNTKLCNKE